MVFRSTHDACAVGIEQGSNEGGAFGLSEFLRHAGQRDRRTDARGHAQLALGNIEQAAQAGTASGQDTAGAEGFEHAALAQIVAQHVEELAGAWLEDFSEQPLPDHTRFEARHPLQLDFTELRYGGDDGVAVLALDPLGLRWRDVQANGEVVREVIATDGDNRSMRDGALEEDD